MKKQNLSIIVAMCCLLLLGACSTTTLSMKQQKALTTVSVSKVEVSEDAYKEPDARKSNHTADAGGMAGGFLGSLVGSAIDAAVMSSQQKKFVEQYGDKFEEIEEMMPVDLADKVEACLGSVLEEDPFFKEKLNPESRNRFVSEINYFGLTRSEIATSDNMLMGFRIRVKVSLLNEEDKEVLSNLMIADSANSYLVSEYTEDSDLLRNAYEECVKNLEVMFADYLAQKLGRK